MELTPFIAGVLLAVGIAAFGKVTRFDQDRSFYPTILIIIASYYILFAILGDSRHALFWNRLLPLPSRRLAFSDLRVSHCSPGPSLLRTAFLTSSTL